MRLVMIGSGYVGLVSGACFADFGHSVICVDKVEARIDTLNKGLMPIFEPGLAEIVRNNVNAGRLKFSIDLADAIKDADVVFIAVGTPSRRGDGHADLAYVHAAAEEVARAARGYCVLVTKSTVPVGTGDEVERIVRRANPSVEIDVVSNPEFLREGSAISDFKRPDRIVVGTDSERAEQVMRAVYRPLYLNEAPIIVCERRTSELIKYAGNAFPGDEDLLHQRNG
jgi:UDPglucose 6-dehydrogenase